MKKRINLAYLICFTITFVSNTSGIKKLTENDIREIYSTYVSPNINYEYLTRYTTLPLHKNNLAWRWEGKDFPRIIAILEFERFVKENKLSCEKGLALNCIDPEWNYLPHTQIIEINYEADPDKHDLHSLDLPEKDFDFVMLNQTLEHVYDPIRCLENVYRHMRPGGILYLNVPANNIPHSIPFHHYTGITPTGLGAIVKMAGFKILSIGQWGNFGYLKKLFELNTWPDYRQIQPAEPNDINCPIITWIFAIK